MTSDTGAITPLISGHEHSAPNTAREPYDLEIPIDQVEASGVNPRRRFDEQSLQDLAASIREHGLLQPLVVREIGVGAEGLLSYRLVAGERRLRAAKLAGLERVPVRVLGDVDDATALRLALVENLQREDLDPLETAEGYRRLQELGLKQQQIAAGVRRSQPVVANTLRLLELPEDVQDRIRSGELSEAHGVQLARYAKFPKLASKIAAVAVDEKLTSKQVGESIPRYWELENQGLLKRLEYDSSFDVKICESCPFDAYRLMDAGRTCLNPKHYRELQEAALAARAEEVRRLTSEAQAQGKPLPRLQDLLNASYRDLRWAKPVPGCTEECTCRAQAVSYENQVVTICTDPACRAKLEKEAEKVKKGEKAKEKREILERLERAIDGLTEIGPREMAVLAVTALGGLQGAPTREAFKRHGHEEIAKQDPSGWQFRRGGAPVLADLDALTLAKATLEAIFRHEVYQTYQLVYGDQGHRASWYLGLAAAGAGEGEVADGQ